ncbi:MAG: glycosyltransferase family 2 protein [[Eubacterium] siraeum]
MEKILSIIIPSYNSKPFLAKCLDSLLCECTDRLDIIVVNDGSTDGCEKIAEEYIAKYPASISLINKVNGGHGSGINVGSERLSANILKDLDADDWFLTENIPQFIKALENTDADVVLTPHHTINISNSEVKSWRCFPPQFDRIYRMDEVMSQWKNFDRSLTFRSITYRTGYKNRRNKAQRKGVLKITNTPLSLAVKQRAYFRSIFSYMNTASAM